MGIIPLVALVVLVVAFPTVAVVARVVIVVGTADALARGLDETARASVRRAPFVDAGGAMFAATARRLARASASLAPSTTSTTRAIERSRVSFASRALADDDTAWSNALMPDLQGKVIRTKIVAVDARNGVATAVTGVRGPTTFKMSEFDRPVRVGDVVEARVTWMNNPTGHLDLECRGLDARRGRERVWRELTRARDGGKTIRGRILNAVNGGYAVGIAGLIAFLPARAYRGRAPPTSVERAIAAEGGGDGGDGGGRSSGKGGDVAAPVVGELYGFKILKMTSSGEHYKNIVVSGPIGGSNAAERRAAAKREAAKARVWGGAENAETVGEAGEDAEGVKE